MQRSHETRPGRDVGEIGHPQPIGRWRLEVAVHPVERARGGLVADRRPHGFAADHALQIHGLHQPRYRAAGDVEAFAPKLTPDLANAVDLEISLEHAPDLDRQGGIWLAPIASSDRPA